MRDGRPNPDYLCFKIDLFMGKEVGTMIWSLDEDSEDRLLLVLKVKVKVEVTQSSPIICDPMDYTVHGILQARILEWVAFPFSRGYSQPRDQTQVSHTLQVDSLPTELSGKPWYCVYVHNLLIHSSADGHLSLLSFATFSLFPWIPTFSVVWVLLVSMISQFWELSIKIYWSLWLCVHI